MSTLRRRRVIGVVVAIAVLFVLIITHPSNYQTTPPTTVPNINPPASGTSLEQLAALPVKGRAAKTGYARTQFGDGWETDGVCDTRNVILQRDLTQVVMNSDCKVMSGLLDDPYSGKSIRFERGEATSDDVQIDHVVALSNAWQTGAQALTPAQRKTLANDPLELLAVDGKVNQNKGDGDAATWLPPNKSFRCQYIARQIAIKAAYHLWVTPAEHDAMARILTTCPDQRPPAIN